MAIYHCSIKIVGRSSKAGAKSAVGAAAYRSGSRLYNSWNGEIYDYTRKGGVLHSEIMLPDHAPRSFLDRSVLWNSVEMEEKRSDAQLAREIEVSLPVELGFEEHLQIIREYCEPFRAAGMCVDFNIHAKEGNPHCHIMLTMRPLAENGEWLPKSRLVYDVDKKGNRIKLPSGKWKSHKENLVDWNEQRKAEEWRAAWADIVNRHLTHAGVEERIDHRSNEARGIQELPGVHMGPAACAMEKKGIKTERGNLNRSIKAANRMWQALRKMIAELLSWLSENRSDESRKVGELFHAYAMLRKEKHGDKSDLYRLKVYANEVVECQEEEQRLYSMGIYTMKDFEAVLSGMYESLDEMQNRMKAGEARTKTLQKNIEMAQRFLDTDSIRKKYNGIKFKKARADFEAANRSKLTLWNSANRYLRANQIDTAALPDSIKLWQKELTQLVAEHNRDYAALKKEREKLKELNRVKRKFDEVLRADGEGEMQKKENVR